MPWMLGPLLGNAALVLTRPPKVLEGYAFPLPFRTFFVGLIGVMIGTQVTADLLMMAAQLPLTIAALVVFTLAAQFGNMAIFQRIGGLDRPTAFFAGTPGGLMESILFGEKAGADMQALMMQQFLRIIVVVSVLPLALSLWLGTPVGSAAGMQSSGSNEVAFSTIIMIALTALAGLYLAGLIQLPASQLIGPMVLAAAINLSGVLDLHLPIWLIALAQMVIGASLGLRFAGVDGALLRRALWLSLLSVGFMLALGLGFAVVLHAATGIDVLVLLISFAPGGVTEMSIIALSLAANPALVSLHHIARILMTVVELTVLSKWLGLR